MNFRWNKIIACIIKLDCQLQRPAGFCVLMRKWTEGRIVHEKKLKGKKRKLSRMWLVYGVILVYLCFLLSSFNTTIQIEEKFWSILEKTSFLNFLLAALPKFNFLHTFLSLNIFFVTNIRKEYPQPPTKKKRRKKKQFLPLTVSATKQNISVIAKTLWILCRL